MSSAAVEYTGHAGDGGLQGHSIGSIYPYVIYRKAFNGEEFFCILRPCGTPGWFIHDTYDEALEYVLFLIDQAKEEIPCKD